MNGNGKNHEIDDYKSFLLLDEISKNDDLTQRDLSNNLGVALGLINSYIKNLAAKGFITVSTIPSKRYKYYLTPNGFNEKTRLAYTHLKNFTNLYRVARRDFRRLFNNIAQSNIKKIIFCGVDEVTEIAFLSLKEVDLELTGVLDDQKKGMDFFGNTVQGLSAAAELTTLGGDIIVITSFQRGPELKSALIAAGVTEQKICDISGDGWLEKDKKQSNE